MIIELKYFSFPIGTKITEQICQLIEASGIRLAVYTQRRFTMAPLGKRAGAK
jgi:hypothetical protein